MVWFGCYNTQFPIILIIGSYLLPDFILDSLIWFPIWLMYNISWYRLDAFDVHLIWLPLECYFVAYILVCMLTSSIIAIFLPFSVHFHFNMPLRIFSFALYNVQWKFCRLIVMHDDVSLCMRNKIHKAFTIYDIDRQLVGSWYGIFPVISFQFSVS